MSGRLDGDAGRDRYDGLLQLLHTLRAPAVGNRIDEGRLPQILLESLPPLHEEALIRAGEQLDGLTETRAAQDRLENSAERVTAFLAVYQRYAAETLRSMARDTLASADAAIEAERNSRRRADELASLQKESGDLQAQAKQLADELTEIDHTLTAIQSREIFKTQGAHAAGGGAQGWLSGLLPPGPAGRAGMPGFRAARPAGGARRPPPVPGLRLRRALPVSQPRLIHPRTRPWPRWL